MLANRYLQILILAELDDFLFELDEDVEGMQSTIYYLQQQLKEAKDQLAQLQQEKRNWTADRQDKTPIEPEQTIERVQEKPAQDHKLAETDSRRDHPMESNETDTTERAQEPASCQLDQPMEEDLTREEMPTESSACSELLHPVLDATVLSADNSLVKVEPKDSAQAGEEDQTLQSTSVRVKTESVSEGEADCFDDIAEADVEDLSIGSSNGTIKSDPDHLEQAAGEDEADDSSVFEEPAGESAQPRKRSTDQLDEPIAVSGIDSILRKHRRLESQSDDRKLDSN